MTRTIIVARKTTVTYSVSTDQLRELIAADLEVEPGCVTITEQRGPRRAMSSVSNPTCSLG